MNQLSKTRVTQKRYDRLASIYDILEAPSEHFSFSRWRPRLLDMVVGQQVLEVGVGTGKNLPYYPPDVHVTAIDLSPRMLEKAQIKASLHNVNVEFLEMDVQHLGFEENTFDTIFTTFVFCSVPDPILGLRELRRVCKLNGRLLLIEHMRPRNPIFRVIFDFLNPVVLRLMGANINRRTIDNILRSGWRILYEECLFSDIVWLIKAEP
ncbi:class I SAM-dependent methyltransferase [Thermodesulfobacteriota bacterium]